MNNFIRTAALISSMLLLTGVQAADPEPLKLGVSLSLSGPFAEDGQQKRQGLELYLEQHGNKLGDRPVKLIYKDDGGANPSLVKRQVSEFILNDEVDAVLGFTITANILASAPVAAQAKVPLISMVPDFPHVLQDAPFVIRTSENLERAPRALARWAAKEDMKTVYTLVSDFGPGRDSEEAFKDEFETLGGTLAGSVRVPLDTVDYSPFVQRVKDSGADALFTMVANGLPAIGLYKAIDGKELMASGVQVLATGGVTGEHALDAIGDAAIGTITAFNYSDAHPSDVNTAFVKAFTQKYHGDRPSYIAVSAYDSIALVDQVMQKLPAGPFTGEEFMAAAKDTAWESPRGPVHVHPETRNMDSTEYYRELQKVDGVLRNVELSEADE